MFSFTRGPARTALRSSQVENLIRSGAVVIGDRDRPQYFDGRFLTAQDLTRDQTYFLQRQSDLSQARGFGVVQGLGVNFGPTATSIRIEAGHGVTPAGELVMLPEGRSLELSDMATVERLDAAFGVRSQPRDLLRNRSGLFIVGLRPVEFTANPITAYPTSVDGGRSLQDGDIIEATAITLIPYPGGSFDLNQRRAQVEWEIFVEGAMQGLPNNVLPLAMIGVNRQVVEWVDPFLVRREIGVETQQILSLGLAPKALREAHFLQYQNRLDQVITLRQNTNQTLQFSASEHFWALPPAGPMPAAAVDTRNFTQSYFPPEIDVELSLVPRDEIAAVIEESLLLPPIDLTLDGDALASTSVLVLVPLSRPRIRQLKNTLPDVTRSLPSSTQTRIAKRSPIELLQELKLPTATPTILEPQDVTDAEWQQIVVSTDRLWYVRRRNLAYRAEIVGVNVPINGEEPEPEPTPTPSPTPTPTPTPGPTNGTNFPIDSPPIISDPRFELERDRLLSRLPGEDLRDRYLRIEHITIPDARLFLIESLNQDFLLEQPLWLGSALSELEAVSQQVDQLNQAEIQPLIERYTQPPTPGGLLDFGGEIAAPLLDIRTQEKLAQTGVVPELDNVLQRLNPSQKSLFVERLAETSQLSTPEQLRTLILRTQARLNP